MRHAMKISIGKWLRTAVLFAALCWGLSSQAQQLPIVKYDIDKVTNDNGSSWQIERESDQVTDKNLKMKFRANEGRAKIS